MYRLDFPAVIPFQTDSNATSTQNTTSGTVAAQTLTYNASASGKGSATGTTSVGNAQATGSVIFTNKSSQLIEIPVGTLLSTASGVTFVTTLDVEIPPASSTYTPPDPIQAQNQGIGGNVAANTIMNITSDGQQSILNFNPGLASTSVLTVTNPQPTTGGGGVGKATALSINDVNILKAKLNVVLQAQLQSWLAKQPRIGDNAGKPEVVETVTTTPVVGSVVTNGTFSETLYMQATVIVVRSAALQSAALAQMNASVSKDKRYPGYTLYQPQQLQITQLKNTPFKDGSSLELSFIASGQIIPNVSVNQIRSLLAGKKVSEVQSTLTGPGGISGIVSSSVVIYPGLFPWLPFLSSHITVHIVPIQSTTGGKTIPPQSTASGGNLLGLPYWLLAAVGLILILLLLLLVSLIVVQRRRQLARFEREQESAGWTERLNAEHIRMEEAARRISGPLTVQPGQAAQPVPSHFADPTPVQRMQASSQQLPADLRCPNCNYPYRGETYCSNCRVGLALSKSGDHVRYVRLVQPPREDKREHKQDNGLSVQKKAENDDPPKVIEVPLQQAATGGEKEISRVGQQFGNYKLLRSLGEGGFAEVYLGEHIHLGSNAAIKILSGRLTGEEQEKFRQEARTLVRLVHPNIVRLLEFGIEDKVPFLVMDYAANGTLRQRHPKGSRLPLPLVVNYVKQAAEALQFAHDLKCIHRDIKPENMLVGSRNEILLSDFGIAIVAQSSRYQNPQDMAGTVTYMAPEQIQLHPRPASDQYALGVVTYEWLCGSRPFQGSFTEIAVKHATVLPPPLRQKVSTISLPVEQVVLKSLAKEPKERFESVQKFAIALELASLL